MTQEQRAMEAAKALKQKFHITKSNGDYNTYYWKGTTEEEIASILRPYMESEEENKINSIYEKSGFISRLISDVSKGVGDILEEAALWKENQRKDEEIAALKKELESLRDSAFGRTAQNFPCILNPPDDGTNGER